MVQEDMIKAIKAEEQRQLIKAINEHGTIYLLRHEYRFMPDERPIIAIYQNKHPCDVIVWAVFYSIRTGLTLLVEEKENTGKQYEIDADKVLAKQLDLVTKEIREQY